MAIRKIRLKGEQLGRIKKKDAERAFDDKSIPEPKIDTVELLLIPIVAGETYKLINHSLNRKVSVQVVDSNGDVRFVNWKHINDNTVEVKWIGSITGNIILQ